MYNYVYVYMYTNIYIVTCYNFASDFSCPNLESTEKPQLFDLQLKPCGFHGSCGFLWQPELAAKLAAKLRTCPCSKQLIPQCPSLLRRRLRPPTSWIFAWETPGVALISRPCMASAVGGARYSTDVQR